MHGRHVPSRVGRVAYTGALVVSDFKLNLPSKTEEKDVAFESAVKQRSKEYQQKLMEVNDRTAQRLLELCLRNGGIFTKLGQQLASLNHALPKEYTTTLSKLQDQALSVPKEVSKPDLKTHERFILAPTHSYTS